MALVCWSGGLDSTLVLYDLAVRYRDDKTPPDAHGLRAVSVVHHQVSCQKQARRARNAIRRAMRKENLAFRHAAVRWRASGEFSGHQAEGGLAQPGLWLAVAQSYLLDDEDLYLGYVKGDDVWHHFSELKQAFAGMQGLAGKTGRLLTPLEWDRKADVIARIRRAKLYRHCWYCEGSNWRGDEPKEPCGVCVPCRTHRAARWVLRQEGGSARPLTVRGRIPEETADDPPKKAARKRPAKKRKR